MNDFIAGEVLLTLRIAFHLITVISILSWTSDHRSRLFSSFLAFLIAGGSLAAAAQGITHFYTTAPNVEFPLVLLSGAWCIVILMNGGNVAQVLHSAKRKLRFGR